MFTCSHNFTEPLFLPLLSFWNACKMPSLYHKSWACMHSHQGMSRRKEERCLDRSYFMHHLQRSSKTWSLTIAIGGAIKLGNTDTFKFVRMSRQQFYDFFDLMIFCQCPGHSVLWCLARGSNRTKTKEGTISKIFVSLMLHPSLRLNSHCSQAIWRATFFSHCNSLKK